MFGSIDTSNVQIETELEFKKPFPITSAAQMASESHGEKSCGCRQPYLTCEAEWMPTGRHVVKLPFCLFLLFSSEWCSQWSQNTVCPACGVKPSHPCQEPVKHQDSLDSTGFHHFPLLHLSQVSLRCSFVFKITNKQTKKSGDMFLGRALWLQFGNRTKESKRGGYFSHPPQSWCALPEVVVGTQKGGS